MTKFSVLNDDLKIKGGGVYCFMPFDNVGDKGMSVFKVGMAIDFKSRLESYHTYFPKGVYMIAFLENPPIPKSLRGKPEGKKTNYYKVLEKLIGEEIIRLGGERILSSTRVRNIKKNNNVGGDTEWFKTTNSVILKAFEKVHLINVKVSLENKVKLDNYSSYHSFKLNPIQMKKHLKAVKEEDAFIGELVFV